jgi:phosphoribosyl 1,2-cyclic phosphodiesterase
LALGAGAPLGRLGTGFGGPGGCQNGSMRVHVMGTRGSTPSPGTEFLRYGGHTSCLALAHGQDAPTLIIDAGTGIRRASALMDGEPFRGAILLGHLHWDHTQGMPFFAAGDAPGSNVVVYAPAQIGPAGEPDIAAVLARAMSPPHFPITPAQLRGEWHFVGLEPGEREVEGFTVLALEIPHKGGRAYGYRVSDGESTLAYLSDHCPTNVGPGTTGLGEYHEVALRLAEGCDVLFHDSQYTDEELAARASFGHSCPGYAVGLGETAGAKRVLLFHHDPLRTDGEIDEMVARYEGAAVRVGAAAESQILELPEKPDQN